MQGKGIFWPQELKIACSLYPWPKARIMMETPTIHVATLYPGIASRADLGENKKEKGHVDTMIMFNDVLQERKHVFFISHILTTTPTA